MFTLNLSMTQPHQCLTLDVFALAFYDRRRDFYDYHVLLALLLHFCIHHSCPT